MKGISEFSYNSIKRAFYTESWRETCKLFVGTRAYVPASGSRYQRPSGLRHSSLFKQHFAKFIKHSNVFSDENANEIIANFNFIHNSNGKHILLIMLTVSTSYS